MIHKQFNNPYVLYQKCGEENIPEQALSISTDNSGLIVINQEDGEIIVNKESVKELTQLLNKLFK